jgi:hypothetical protein
MMELLGYVAILVGGITLMTYAALRMAAKQDSEESRMPLTIHEQKMALYRRAQREVAEQLRLRKEQQ